MHIEELPLNYKENDGFSANETFRVDFPAPIAGAPTNRGIAKGDKKAGQYDEHAGQYKGLSDSCLDSSQTTVLKDLNLISRSVAASNVGKALGLGSVVPEAYANKPGGGYMGVSALASGSQMMVNVVDEKGLPKNTITRDFDFSRPDIQKGLYDLEAVDYITGQIDRHSGNIFINHETGQVEGIDNDLCFGDKPLSAATTDAAIGVKAIGAPPYFYHEDTAAAIEQMTPESLSAMLREVSAPDGSCTLSDAEIEAACERLETMKASIQLARSEGRVVSEFNKETFDASIAHHQEQRGEAVRGKYAGTGNYVARSQQELELAKELTPHGFDIVEAPANRELSDYEQELKRLDQDIKQAEAVAILSPSDELQQARNEQYLIKQEIQEIDAALSSKMENKQSLKGNNAISKRAAEARQVKIQELSACQASNAEKKDSPKITERQAALLRVTAGIDVKAGDRLDQQQRQVLGSTLKNLNAGEVSKSRSEQVKNEKAFVQSTAPELQQQKKEALGRLSQANAKVKSLVQQQPGVAQAVKAKQNYIASQKELMLTPQISASLSSPGPSRADSRLRTERRQFTIRPGMQPPVPESHDASQPSRVPGQDPNGVQKVKAGLAGGQSSSSAAHGLKAGSTGANFRRPAPQRPARTPASLQNTVGQDGGISPREEKKEAGVGLGAKPVPPPVPPRRGAGMGGGRQ